MNKTIEAIRNLPDIADSCVAWNENGETTSCRIRISHLKSLAGLVEKYQAALAHYAPMDSWKCSECETGVDHDDACLYDLFEENGFTVAAICIADAKKIEEQP